MNAPKPPTGSLGPADGDEFLTVAQVAEALKLNQQTIRNWIDQGSLRALRIGRRVRIRRTEFERLVSSGLTQKPTYTGDQFWGGEPHPAPDIADG
jgi:excisionase family DNA binding protein